MKTYAITGGATGIGAALKELLLAQGDRVIVVDIRGGDIIADLSTETGRRAAVEGIHALAPEGLDGFVPCAGVPPVAKPLSLIPQVNYFAVVATVSGVRELLAKKQGSALIVSSNSAPMIPADDPYVEACLAGDEKIACELIEQRDGHTAYAGSKRAITQWVRRNAADFARDGVRLNAIAPGITATPLTEQVLADEALGEVMRAFAASVPLGESARPEQIARVMRFMLSPEADFLCGSVFFVDGGSDAMLRSDAF